jgi:alkylhydroperoxidase family enzyme
MELLLNTVAPEEATGSVAAAYGIFPKEIGLPVGMRLLSASPELLEGQVAYIKHSMRHKGLSAPLMAAIRYVSAQKSGHKACISLNSGMLQRMGMETVEVEALLENPAAAGLEPREATMLEFVLQALDAPGSVDKQVIEKLRSLNYSDADILDALNVAARMHAASILYKALVRE